MVRFAGWMAAGHLAVEPLVARTDRDVAGEIAARALADQSDALGIAAERCGILQHPLIGCERILMRCGELGFGPLPIMA